MNASCLSRRGFLKGAAGTVAACAVCRPWSLAAADAPPAAPLHEARFYETLEDKAVRCGLCPWACVVPDGQRGRCEVRENRGGRYYTLVYGRSVCRTRESPGVNDPIEKKPFFHVYPGSRAFSIATVGCNFDCAFCQNWDISQKRPEDLPVPEVAPADIAKAAAAAKCRTVAYTYSEPTIFAEYVIDCARAARELGLGNVVISNGFIAEAPLKEWIPLLTAIKIDFKAFTTKFYEETCAGQLQPVLDTLKRLKDGGLWFEMVMLTIPTLNDSLDDIKRMSDWIVKELGPDVPLHFTRFHPDYKLRNLPNTPVDTLLKARQVALDHGCHFVYTGNAPGIDGQSTFCPKCKAVVIDRYGYTSKTAGMKNGLCGQCGAAIPGVW